MKTFSLILGLLMIGGLVFPLKTNAVEVKPSPREGLISKIFIKAAIGTGKVTAILPAQANSSYGVGFSVVKDDKTYTVWTDSKTGCRRNFWGKCDWSEIQVNDTVNVIGKWTDDAHTTVLAKLIRDLSIQKRFGVFFGTVESVTSSGWVVKTGRGNETVTVSSSTRFVNRKEQNITQSDIVVGHKVRIKGLWNKANNTITEVAQVKDFSLPEIVKPSPSPTQ